jgi:hypothetical protein
MRASGMASLEASPGVSMLPFLLSQVAALTRAARAVVLFALFAALTPASLQGAEPRIVALHNLESAEVRQQGFTLPRTMRIHIYAKGGGPRQILRIARESPLFAYGWILNATTREVVWQMDGSNTKREWEFCVADKYMELPAGSYEAYFANHGFSQGLLFAQWTRNIDRRSFQAGGPEPPHGFVIGVTAVSFLRHWREQVGNYGMEIYLPEGQHSEVSTFEAPLRWKNIVVALPANTDNGHWTQAFHVRRPITMHIYAEGEGSGRSLQDYGWITDARSRVRVWEMSMDRSQYAGGATKNRRQVETIQLPSGDYEANFITDDSHSPADWNAAPPCDPGLYGLTLSVPSDADLPAVSLTQPLAWTVLSELVRVGNSQDLRSTFSLAKGQQVRVYALAEGTSRDMVDEAWIEDADGRRVWAMERSHTHHAGGATKNRLADELVRLSRGMYTLRFRTDDSHAYGHWTDDPPFDPEHYGVTVYAVE